MNTQPDLREILTRLDSIERQNRRLRVLAAAAILAVSCVGLMAAAGKVEKGIDVERLSLRDPTGRERCRLEVDAKGDVVQSFIDSDGTQRIRLSVDAQDNAALAFQHKPDDERAMVYLSKDGDSGFVMRDGVKTRIESIVRSSGVARQQVRDGRGIVRIETETSRDGAASQAFSDKAGTKRVSIATTPTGNALVTMQDQAGESRFLWGTMPDGLASHMVFDKGGKPRFVSMTLADGNAAQHAVDQDGVPRIEQWTTSEGFAYQQINDKKHTMRFVSATGPNGEAIQGGFDDEGKQRHVVATRPDGTAFQSLNGKQAGDPYALLLSSPGSGIVHQFAIGEGTLKVGTRVAADGTASHYVEKGAVEQGWSLVRSARELVGILKDGDSLIELIKKYSKDR